MGKRILNLNKKLGAIYLALLVVLIFVLSFLYFKNGVKGTLDESLPRVVYIDNEKRIIDAEGNDPLKALKDNGIEVFPEDRVTTELILDPISAGAVGEKIVVKRAPVLHVFADNKNTDFRSWLKTIGDVFKEKAFPLGPKDIVDPSQQTLISNGAYVTVTRINEFEEEKESPIAFETSYEKDYWLPKGQTRTKQAGVNGVKKQIFKVRLTNGVETSRTLISQSTIQKPVTQIIIKGVKPTNDKYGWWPTIVAAASRYGVDAEAMHNVMYCESKGYADSHRWDSYPYKGLFQYEENTWYGASSQAGYSGASIYDGTAQIYVTAWKVSKQGWRAWGCKP